MGLLALMFVGAGNLRAGTIEARVDGLVAYGQVQMSLDGGAWATSYAGLIRLARTGGSSELELLPDDSNLYAFCVEPREGISLNQTYTWETGPMTAAPTSLGGMTATQANQLLVLMNTGFANFTASITNQQALALQIAIWEIVEEKNGTLDVATGSIRFRNPSIAGTLEIAQNLLNQVNTQPAGNNNIWLITSEGNQDLMIQALSAPGDLSTPEPATLSMMGLGLLALGMASRKHTKAV